MNQSVKELEGLVERLLAELIDRPDLFVVGIRAGGSRSTPAIQVVLDGDRGIDVEACSSVSRRLSTRLDEEETLRDGYKLEVSSPGIDQPLRLQRQYPKNVGRQMKVTLQDGTILRGTLMSAEGDAIVLLPGKTGGKKKGTPEAITVLHTDIEDARVEISFH
jgi:ribosome maturation factor RimP